MFEKLKNSSVKTIIVWVIIVVLAIGFIWSWIAPKISSGIIANYGGGLLQLLGWGGLVLTQLKLR